VPRTAVEPSPVATRLPTGAQNICAGVQSPEGTRWRAGTGKSGARAGGKGPGRRVTFSIMSHEAHDRLGEFAEEVAPRLRGELRLDRLSRALYATDASMYQVEPLGVLLPAHVEDVAAAIESAARHGIPVLPRGSGSSLAGSAVGAALVIDTSGHLDAVRSFDPDAREVTVEPGVVLDHLNAWLAGPGVMTPGVAPLRVGPDPASSSRATLGGMVGTNATGTRSIRYGSVVDHIVEARALLPDGTEVRLRELDAEGWERKLGVSGREGELYRALDRLLDASGEVVERDTPRHWRRAGGYRLERLLDPAARNLAQLLCGSEGTLAFLTEVTLRLVDRPRRSALGVTHFPTRRAALEAVESILETDPSAVELFDRIALERARSVPEYRGRLHFVQGDPGALLIVEYDGQVEPELRDRLERLGRMLGGSAPVTQCLEPAQVADVWAVRKAGLGLAMSARLPVQCLAFIEDAAVPVEHLPDYIERLEGVLRDHETDAVMYAHASAGCLHVRPFLDTREPLARDRMESISRASAELVREYGGVVSSEHGDGLARSWLAPGFHGRELYEAYVGVKDAFDPERRFNPRRVVEAPPMTEHLRNARPLQVLPVVPTLDWSREGGLARAVEACNGQGVCRKRLSGTMCPSFMVTRDELDSTRGRANVLRQIFSGDLPAESLTGHEMKAAMDLCVSCKACRSECPAEVDMAALKAEWQGLMWREEAPPLRTRMVAHQPEVARRVAGPLAPLANAVMRTAPAKAVLARMGFAPGRQLPPFARHPFREDEVGSGGGAGAGRVALYADTFSRFHEPWIPRAAVLVLRAAGYEIVVPEYRCCGRTLISKGFLETARSRMDSLLTVLDPIAAEGIPVVGLEPSCLLTLRDEAFRLLPGDPRVERVSAAARTFEEFVAENEDRFRELYGRGTAAPLLLHGHCHQKALSDPDAGRACLAVAGYEVEVLDAGCCGMAGSFGYEAEHEEVSRRMAGRILVPAIEGVGAGVGVAAAGTSCRHQIADCTARRARHPAEHLADRLAGGPTGHLRGSEGDT
jgi:FAD/FMN-containing dehydrogenase/Fe-S oxidoreductase